MSVYMSYLLAFILAFLYLTRGQVPFPGSCPKVHIVETFDLDRYMGTWYEYSKYPFVFEVGQKCQQAVYKNLGDGNISVVNTGVYVIINKAHSTKGTAKVLAPGQLAVSFGSKEAETANYLVLDTDYENYAVVYSCRNVTSYGHTENLWILSRQRQLSENDINRAKEVLKNNNLSERFLMTSTQTSCPNIPESNTDDKDQIAAETSTSFETENSIDFASTSTERVINNA